MILVKATAAVFPKKVECCCKTAVSYFALIADRQTDTQTDAIVKRKVIRTASNVTSQSKCNILKVTIVDGIKIIKAIKTQKEYFFLIN